MRTLYVIALAIGLMGAAGAQTVWGIKSRATGGGFPTQQPTHLFSIAAGVFTDHGPLKLVGNPQDFDGLARSPSGDLWCFWVTPNGSQLGKIDPATMDVVLRPNFLPAVQARGAMFDSAGRLWMINSANNSSNRMDLATGLVAATAPLTLAAAPFPVTDMNDLAPTAWGPMLVSMNRFLRINPATGVLLAIGIDGVAGPDGFVPGHCGLAGLGAAVFALDVQMQDDVFRYTPAAGWARSLPFPNIIPGFNSGRGDLTSNAQGGMIGGNIKLGGYLGNLKGLPVRFRLFDKDGNMVDETTEELTSDGKFEFFTSAEGQVLMTAKMPRSLRRAKLLNLNQGDTSNVDFELLNGDIDDDNAVTVFDYALLSEAFDTKVGDPKYNPEADLDGDEAITVFDYAILSENFDQSGD